MSDYIGRFNFEVVTIPNLQQDVAVLALISGLKEGTPFRSYLGRKKLTSLTEILGKANEFIRREEFDKATTAKRSEGDGKEKDKDKDKYRKDKKLDGLERKDENNLLKKGHDGRSDRYYNYTPLTMSIAEIYELHKKDNK